MGSGRNLWSSLNTNAGNTKWTLFPRFFLLLFFSYFPPLLELGFLPYLNGRFYSCRDEAEVNCFSVVCVEMPSLKTPFLCADNIWVGEKTFYFPPFEVCRKVLPGVCNCPKCGQLSCPHKLEKCASVYAWVLKCVLKVCSFVHLIVAYSCLGCF